MTGNQVICPVIGGLPPPQSAPLLQDGRRAALLMPLRSLSVLEVRQVLVKLVVP